MSGQNDDSKYSLRRFARNQDGVAAIEAALLFPLLLVLLLGIIDAGNAVLAGQKAIRSSQIAADLIARKPSVTATDVSEAIEAARLSLLPFETDSLGIDIVSLEFTDDSTVTACWRETFNMAPNMDVMTSVSDLGIEGDGLLVVTIRYQYEPTFSGPMTGPIIMEESAFVRGRKSAVVEYEGGCT